MFCGMCGANEAVFHIEGIVNGKGVFLHLCDECAKKKGLEFNTSKPHFSLVDLLDNLSDWEIPGHRTIINVACPNCGLTYGKFKEIARLGCAKCYESFSDQLVPLLKRIHGSSRHKGKKPSLQPAEIEEKIVKLKNDLVKAIKEEEYEKAAELRDRIKDLKKQAVEDK